MMTIVTHLQNLLFNCSSFSARSTSHESKTALFFLTHWVIRLVYCLPCTCNSHLQRQKDADLALQKQLLYTAPSCGHRTNVAVSGKGLPLLEYSPYSHIFR